MAVKQNRSSFFSDSVKMNTIIATEEHQEFIVSITNDAFVADCFFKKPAFYLRFDLDTVKSMMRAENSVFIVATQPSDNGVLIVGSIFLHWEIEEKDSVVYVVGKFSAVSVPTKYERRGIGKALVTAAETKLQEIAKEMLHSNMSAEPILYMEMGVINLRKDLFPWYESQGYVVIKELRPNDPEFNEMCLDELDVCCVLMRKQLVFSA